METPTAGTWGRPAAAQNLGRQAWLTAAPRPGPRRPGTRNHRSGPGPRARTGDEAARPQRQPRSATRAVSGGAGNRQGQVPGDGHGAPRPKTQSNRRWAHPGRRSQTAWRHSD